MEMQKSKVYVLPDGNGYITRIDGGYTTPVDLSDWILIDEGYGDRYNLCQNNYFPMPIITEGGAYRYKLVDGVPVECTAEEIAAYIDALPMPEPQPTVAELQSKVTDLEAALELLVSGATEVTE